MVKLFRTTTEDTENNEEVARNIYECSTTLPTFIIVIDGYPATVPSDYLNFEEVGSGNCSEGMQSNGGICFASQYLSLSPRSGNMQPFYRKTRSW